MPLISCTKHKVYELILWHYDYAITVCITSFYAMEASSLFFQILIDVLPMCNCSDMVDKQNTCIWANE